MKSIAILGFLYPFVDGVSFTELNHREFIKSNNLQKVSDINTGFFEQKLDHFNHNDRSMVYNQRFHEKKFGEGPMFIYIGGEGTLTDGCLRSGMFRDMSETYEAHSFCLEHRFYGESFPENKFVELDDLKYLSSHQALADLAYFISKKKSYSHQKVIVFGCSYPGSLAAWSRSKYPGLIQGAISSSSPIAARREFKEFDKIVATSIPEDCRVNLMKLTQAVETALTDDNEKSVRRVVERLGCPLAAQQLPLSDLRRSILHVVAEVLLFPVQYNFPPTRDYSNNLCSRLAEGVLDSEQYANVEDRLNALINSMAKMIKWVEGKDDTEMPMMGASCDQQNMMLMLPEYTSKDTAVGRAWNYQCCSEFGFWQMADLKEEKIARSKYLQIDYYEDVCEKTFPLSSNGGFPKWDLKDIESETNSQLQGYSNFESISGATNIHFTNGELDPWKALSVTHIDENIQKKRNISFHVVPGASHCSDFRVAGNNEDVKLAQEKIELAIRSFLIDQDQDMINRI